MKSNHTPGPWAVNGHNLCCVIAGPYGAANITAHICSCEYGYQKHAQECIEMDKANARLIAAAPELLAALESLVALSHDNAGSTYTLREIFGTFSNNPQIEGLKALAAIAKAKGETK